MMSSTPPFNPQPLTLANDVVCLEPVAFEHCEGLFHAAQFPQIWEFHAAPLPDSRDAISEWIAAHIAMAGEQRDIAFTLIDKQSNTIVGLTRFMDISIPNRSLEIGGTWLMPRVWRTPINTNCKWLLLSHAFEQLGAVRVYLKTDVRNTRSQRAIERIGAVREGVLRKHMILKDGSVRDTAYYSIVDDEWPGCRCRLETMLRTP